MWCGSARPHRGGQVRRSFAAVSAVADLRPRGMALERSTLAMESPLTSHHVLADWRHSHSPRATSPGNLRPLPIDGPKTPYAAHYEQHAHLGGLNMAFSARTRALK